MTEQQIKQLCKFAVENGNRAFTKQEKELLKQAVDDARNLEELFLVALASLNIAENTTSVDNGVVI